MCHGFPELAYSAGDTRSRRSATPGFRAIAPDQRGYGLTSRPEKVEDYDIHHLTGDMVGMLDALGIKKAVFVGHDWGGIVVWYMPLLHPDRVAGVIGVNTPFMPRAPMDPIALMRMSFGEDMYIVHFQKPARRTRFSRKTSIAPCASSCANGACRSRSSTSSRKRREACPSSKPFRPKKTSSAAELVMSEEELKFFVDTFKKTGFTGGINWYRNFTRNWQTTEGIPQKVNVPCLMIMAENDIVLRPSMAQRDGGVRPRPGEAPDQGMRSLDTAGTS